MIMDDNDIRGPWGLKLPDICLTVEEKHRKNLTQETCPDRGSNPGPLRDRRACYHLSHSGGLLVLPGLYTDPPGCREQKGRPILDLSEILPLVFVLWINPRNLPQGTTLCLPRWLEGRFSEDSRESATSLSGAFSVNGGSIQILPIDEGAPMMNRGTIFVLHWIAPFESGTKQRGHKFIVSPGADQRSQILCVTQYWSGRRIKNKQTITWQTNLNSLT